MPRKSSRLMLVSALIVMIGASIWLARENGFFGRHNWGVVEEGRIYRSGRISGYAIRSTLNRYRIGMIVCMSSDKDDDPDAQAERQAAAEMGIERLILPLDGNGIGDPRMYASALGAICRAQLEGKVVLVHCSAGSQRTGGVVALYRMLIQHQPAEQARAELLSYGHDPARNVELIPFLNEHMRELVGWLVSAKVIDKTPDPLPRLSP